MRTCRRFFFKWQNADRIVRGTLPHHRYALGKYFGIHESSYSPTGYVRSVYHEVYEIVSTEEGLPPERQLFSRHVGS